MLIMSTDTLEKKLEFVIVTYQRSAILEELLDIAGKTWEAYGTGVCIMDGSLDDKTEEMVRLREEKNLKYFHLPNSTIGERILLGIQKSRAEYICICGDSVRPQFQNYSDLFRAFDEKYDLIDFSYRDPQNIGNKEYTSIIDMYKDLTWDMTQMGNVFFRRDSFSCFKIDEYRKRYHTEYFIQNAIYFDCFNKNQFRGLFCNRPIITTYTKEKKNGWTDKIIEVAAYGWCDYVINSPAIYNIVKTEVALSHGKYSCLRLDKLSSFIKLAIKKQLSQDVFLKYKSSIREISPLPIGQIEFISKIHLDKLYGVYMLMSEAKKKVNMVLGK